MLINVYSINHMRIDTVNGKDGRNSHKLMLHLSSDYADSQNGERRTWVIVKHENRGGVCEVFHKVIESLGEDLVEIDIPRF